MEMDMWDIYYIFYVSLGMCPHVNEQDRNICLIHSPYDTLHMT